MRALRIASLLATALAVSWLMIVSGLSFSYSFNLLHPVCPPSGFEPPAYQSVTLTGADGLPLKGWWKAPSNRTVILLLGGQGSNRDALLPEAELFSRHGYGILTLDTRPCLGLISTLGALESRDLAPMLNFAATQPGVNRVAGLGFSVGAVSLLMGAPQQPQLRSLIAEGNFPNLYSEFTAVPAPLFSFTWQVQRASAASYWLLTGIPPWMVSPLDALASLKDRQVLLIHGEKEAWRTKPEMQLAASGSGARLWVVPGADHGEYYQAAPLEYERRVIEFLEQSR